MLRESVLLGYACAVVGIPLVYVAIASFRARKPWGLAAIVASGLLLWAFPVALLTLLWWTLYGMMAAALVVFLGHIMGSAALLFVPGRRPAVRDVVDPPTVAILIPARNEASVITACLDALLRAEYPADRLMITVIDDGSTDETAACVAAYQSRCRNLRLVNRASSAERGKAAALNQALAGIDAEFTVILDADHQIAGSFFRTTLPHFDDPRVAGVQVRKVGRNWAKNWLTRLMELESLGWQYAFLDTKSRAQLVTVYFGSGCIFRTALLKKLGGLSNRLATEDLEASFRIYEAGYRITFEPRTYTTDELVSTARGFFHQRYRWARGTTQAIPGRWSSFYRHGSPTWREKVDFAFYPILLSMMIVPYLQVAVHAIALALGIALPVPWLMPLSYFGVIFLCYAVTALRNQRDSEGQTTGKFQDVVFWPIAMFAFYGLFFAVINVKAFLDEFVIGASYQAHKTDHIGGQAAARPASSERVSGGLNQQLLVTLGRPSPDPEQIRYLAPRLEEADWNLIKDSALAHGVAGFIYANLVDHGLAESIPASVRTSLRSHRRAVLVRNLYLRQLWGAIVEAFTHAEIEVAPLKGMHLIDHILQPDVRPLFDIDLLVKRSRVEDASRQLVALGYQPLRNRRMNGQSWCTQRSFRHSATGVVVDLHWDLMNVYTYQRIYRSPIDDVWSRARPSPGQACVYELAPEDRIFHAALHCAIHHNFSSLLHFADLRALLQAYQHVLNWDRLAELATLYRVKTPLYSALVLGKTLFDAPVSETAMSAIRPRFYRRLCWYWLLPEPRKLLGGRLTARREQTRWAWTSVILADTLWDSVRTARASLAFGLAGKDWDEPAG